MKFDFDFTTLEGRRTACEQFSEALKDHMNGEHEEEACILAYQDEKRTHSFGVGYAEALSELQAKILCQYPSLIEPTLKRVPVMLIMKHLSDQDED